MALVIEDGTGLPDANSYGSVEGADAYFELRGNKAWTELTEEAKSSALVQATDYIDLRWRDAMLGKRLTAEQALEFPRLVCPNDGAYYPKPLQRALYEYAVIASAGPLAPNIQYDETGRVPTRFRDKVGPIEEETFWTTGSGALEPNFWRAYRVADSIMQTMTTPKLMGGRVMR